MSARREYADFRIVDEPWNRYKLDDGTILKIRVIMTDVRVMISQTGQKNYSADFKYYIGHVIPAKNFIEPPNPKHFLDDIKSQDNLVDINHTRILEKISQYELDDGTLVKAKLEFKLVKRSKLALDNGAPCYFLFGYHIWNEIERPRSF